MGKWGEEKSSGFIYISGGICSQRKPNIGASLRGMSAPRLHLVCTSSAPLMRLDCTLKKDKGKYFLIEDKMDDFKLINNHGDKPPFVQTAYQNI